MIFLRSCRVPAVARIFPLVISAGIFFAGRAFVTIETDTFVVSAATVVVRASSRLPGAGRAFGPPTMFDGDSATCWIEGIQDARVGRWLEVRYPEKKRFKGIVLGAGCRKDRLCLEEFSVPLKLRIKLDEKPAFEYGLDWDVRQGVISRQEVNMRKAVIWFDSDTAFTTALVQMKFAGTLNGTRYLNLAISDFELVDAHDSRFALLDVLSGRTFNPNDLGAVIHRSIIVGDDGPARIGQVLDSIYKSESSDGWRRDSSQIEKGLNAGMRTIADNAELLRLVGVLKGLFIGRRQNDALLRGRAQHDLHAACGGRFPRPQPVEHLEIHHHPTDVQGA